MIALRVGERLKELRGGQTQADFAQRLGLSQAQYNRYETGKRLAPDRIIEAVAQRCGLTPQEVVWGPRPAPAPASATPTPPGEAGQAVASLLALLDQESLEDLYYFLKRKTEELAKRRHLEVRQAQQALEILKRQAG